MRQSKRASTLQRAVEDAGLRWGGWQDGAWVVVNGEIVMRCRTLGDVELLLERLAEERVVSAVAGLSPDAAADVLARVGDHVVIDRGGRVEVRGTVEDVIGGTVVVRAEYVKVNGIHRPDLEGRVWLPSQNGTPQPWGESRSLTFV